MAPPLKIARIGNINRLTAEQVHQSVALAVISSDASAYSLLSEIESGYEKDIVTGLIMCCASKAQGKQKLTKTILAFSDRYFFALGVESALERLNELEKVLNNHIEQEGSARNTVVLLGHFLETVNLVSHHKLRAQVKQVVPRLVRSLWDKKSKAEACYLARKLVYVLNIGGINDDEKAVKENKEEAKKIWYEMATDKIRKHPVMCCLTYMVDHRAILQRTLTLTDLEDLVEDIDEMMCMKTQMIDIVERHAVYILSRLPEELTGVLFQFVIMEYTKLESEEKLKSFITMIGNSSYVANYRSTIWRHVIYALIKSIQLDLEEYNQEQPSKSAIIGSFADVYISDKEKEQYNAYLISIVSNFLKLRSLENSTKKNKTAKVKCGPATGRIIEALHCVPLCQIEEMDHAILNGTIFILCSMLKKVEPKIVQRGVSLLAKSLRAKKTIVIQIDMSEMSLLLHDVWMPQEENRTEYDIEMRNEVITILATSIKSSQGDFAPIMIIIPEDDDVDAANKWKLDAEQTVMWLSAFLESLTDHPRGGETKEVMKKFMQRRPRLMKTLMNNGDFDVSTSSALDRITFLMDKYALVPYGEKNAFVKKLFSSAQTSQLLRIAIDVLSGRNLTDMTDSLRLEIEERSIGFLARLALNEEYSEIIHANMLNWHTIDRISKARRNQEKFVNMIPAEKFWSVVPDMIGEISVEDENASARVESMMILMSLFLANEKVAALMGEHVDCILELLEKGCENVKALALGAEILKIASGQKFERDMVSTSLAVAAQYPMENLKTEKDIRIMEELLYNAIRYTPQSLMNDQCSLFGQLLINYMGTVHRFTQSKEVTPDVREKVLNGPTRISHQMLNHEKYFSRIVAFHLSEMMLYSDDMRMTMYKLHSMVDKHSSAMLSTCLPPAEKRNFSRVFPQIKKALARIT